MTNDHTKWVSRFWYALMLPWIFIAPLAGMAFDSRSNAAAWIVVSAVWSFPVVIALSVWLRRKKPLLAFLPALNFILPFAIAAFLDAVGMK